MANVSEGWEGILEEGETILWQGRPNSAIHWHSLVDIKTAMGLFFCLLSGGWIVGMLASAPAETRELNDDIFDYVIIVYFAFGALFFFSGLYMIIGRLMWDAYVRRCTWYTLSDRAAYVATMVMGKRDLKRYAKEKMIPPLLTDGDPGDVFFARDEYHYVRRSKLPMNNANRPNVESYYVPVGFRRIDNPRTVYRLVCEVQQAADTL